MCGEVIVADIGFPPPNFDVKGRVIELEDVRKFFKDRDIASHKGNYGHLLIVGGFSGLMGAPILAGISAYKVGVGLVSLLLPNIPSSKKAIPPILLDYYGDDYFLQEGDIEKVERILDRVTAIVIGPGLGRKQESAGLVKRVLRIGKERDIPVVVDADALYLLGEHKYDGGFVVLTPHIGEFVRISGYMKDEVLKEPIRCALEFAKRNEVILHLKFASSITVLRDGVYYINPTGNPGMAVGGSGDVLAGMIGGMLAQHKDESIVPIIAYLFGMAGDIARDFVGEVSLTPENVMEYIPTAINRIKSNIF
jgi:NAD(P)H-hydrate epimerase